MVTDILGRILFFAGTSLHGADNIGPSSFTILTDLGRGPGASTILVEHTILGAVDNILGGSTFGNLPVSTGEDLLDGKQSLSAFEYYVSLKMLGTGSRTYFSGDNGILGKLKEVVGHGIIGLDWAGIVQSEAPSGGGSRRHRVILGPMPKLLLIRTSGAAGLTDLEASRTIGRNRT